jgi:hypothetical protein
MSNILKSEVVGASSENDLVHLQLGRHKIHLYYQTAFDIVNSIRMAAKLSLRHEGLQMPDWRALDAEVAAQLPPKVKRNRIYRRTNAQSNISRWSVDWEGSLVVLHFDELTCKMHYADAFRLHGLLRHVATNAKNWAGDPSRSMRATAYLNNAEENYKHGYAV